MGVFDRKRRHEASAPSRVTCSRCHREYTREAHVDAVDEVDEYCWWCAARISGSQMPVVTE